QALHSVNPARFEHVVSSQHVDLHGQNRVVEHGLNPCNRGQMHDDLAASHAFQHGIVIQNIAMNEADILVLNQVRVRQGIAVLVIEDDYFIVFHQTHAQSTSDKARATRYENSLIM